METAGIRLDIADRRAIMRLVDKGALVATPMGWRLDSAAAEAADNCAPETETAKAGRMTVAESAVLIVHALGFAEIDYYRQIVADMTPNVREAVYTRLRGQRLLDCVNTQIGPQHRATDLGGRLARIRMDRDQDAVRRGFDAAQDAPAVAAA